MPAELVKNDDTLEISLSACRGLEFQDALAKIKDIPGRRYDGERKLWCLPAEPAVAERVVNVLAPTMPQDVTDWLVEERTSAQTELTTRLPEDAELLIPWGDSRMPWQPEVVNDEEFNGLFNWQRAAVDHMAAHRRVILADDMGLGKTLQAISAVEEYRLRNTLDDGFTVPDGPKLVVCPNSVKGSWKRELNRWLEDPTYIVVDGATPAKRAAQIEEGVENDAWVIANWEQLRIKKEVVKLKNGGRKTVKLMKEPLFEKTDWLAVIADEAHHAKNRNAQQTQGLWRCQGQIMLALTGTPIMNSPDELWAILKWLFPKEYTAYWRFFHDYCDSYEIPGRRGRVVTGVRNPDALRYELRNRLLRRTADLLGLKGRKRFYFDVDLLPKQRKLYDEAKKALWLEVKQAALEGDEDAKQLQKAIESNDANSLYAIKNGGTRTVRLRQIVETPATLGAEDDSAILDDCVEKVMDSQPTQWIVFCEFKPTVACLAERLEKQGLRVATYTGDTKAGEARTAIEDAYQRGDLDVVVGTIDAMYQGITLTAGHNQYWVSRNWVQERNEQGESREDRLGQQERVNVWIPIAEDTVAASKVQPANTTKDRIVRSVLPKVKIEEEYL